MTEALVRDPYPRQKNHIPTSHGSTARILGSILVAVLCPCLYSLAMAWLPVSGKTRPSSLIKNLPRRQPLFPSIACVSKRVGSCSAFEARRPQTGRCCCDLTRGSGVLEVLHNRKADRCPRVGTAQAGETAGVTDFFAWRNVSDVMFYDRSINRGERFTRSVVVCSHQFSESAPEQDLSRFLE